MKILVLNFGSSSAKSQLIDTSAEQIAENRDRLLVKVTVVAALGRPRPSKLKLVTGPSVTPPREAARSWPPPTGCAR